MDKETIGFYSKISKDISFYIRILEDNKLDLANSYLIIKRYTLNKYSIDECSFNNLFLKIKGELPLKNDLEKLLEQ